MTNFVNHSDHRGCVFFDHSVIHFLEAEGVESAFLHCRTVDTALYLGDFNLSHCEIVVKG